MNSKCQSIETGLCSLNCLDNLILHRRITALLKFYALSLAPESIMRSGPRLHHEEVKVLSSPHVRLFFVNPGEIMETQLGHSTKFPPPGDARGLFLSLVERVNSLLTLCAQLYIMACLLIAATSRKSPV